MRQASPTARLRRTIGWFLTVALISTLIVLASPPRARAADFACGSGDVACLKAAINDANADAAVDTITLDGSIFSVTTVDNTVLGPNGLPAITSPIIIEGNGATIERALTAPPSRLFFVDLGGDLRLNRVTVRNGSLPSGPANDVEGGGILNIGILTLTNSTVADNRAGDNNAADGFAGSGGGISNRAIASIQNSTIRGNRAGNSSGTNSDGGCGGGIFVADALITGVSSIVEIVDSTIADNLAGDGPLADGRGGGGGGICTRAFGDVELTRSLVRGNSAGRGFGGGHGGGFHVGSSSVVNITNSTFYDNAAGGAPLDGTVFGGFGGAIDVGGVNAQVTITNSTIVRNRPGLVAPAGSILNGKGGALVINLPAAAPNTVNVKNTIIHRNWLLDLFSSQVVWTDCSGAPPTDLGYNIENRTECGFSAANNSQPSTDARVAGEAPADYGGPTHTIALCTGPGTPAAGCGAISPAIDAIPAGTSGCGAPIDEDQRGFPRPVDGNGSGTAQCDIGAFEAMPTPVCGNGTVEPGEACDDGNTADGDCCSSACQFEPATTVCRDAANACDVAETCTGSSATCPANTFQPSGTACGDPAATACTSPDSCDGHGICQPHHEPDGTLCSDGNACTIDDACTAGTCGGHQLTCLGVNATICGTDGNDTLIGTDGPDVIVGLAGNDIIRGRDGDDVMCGGDGNDTIEGGDGNDRIDGGEGNDILRGQNGDDTIYGGGGNDTLEGGAGNDHLDGGPGTDRLRGGAGTDVCVNGEIVESCP